MSDVNREFPEGMYMASVKIGPKGQIVIPKEVRDMFGVGPGDTMLLLADVNRGIALNRMDYFRGIANAVFDGKAADSGEMMFASGVKNIEGEEKK